MELSSDSIRVQIFGDEYSIKSDSGATAVKDVAQFVNGKMTEMQELTASRDKMKVAVLSALNIAGELMEFREKCQQQQAQLDDLQSKIESISQRIETTIA